MKITKLYLEGFRGYSEPTEIPIEKDLTVFIGRNDVGKSTLIDALDLFLEGGIVKPELNDLSIGRAKQWFIIGVRFSDFPTELTLDSGAKTDLEKEYLTINGHLEVFKKFDCNLKQIKPSIFARAYHPTNEKYSGLLLKTQTQLKTIVKELKLEEKCKQNENPSMRHAIFDSIGEKELKLVVSEVPLEKQDGKDVWATLQKKYLPIFALFRSDRQGSEKDSEIKEPMDIAVERALDKHTSELEKISEDVRKRVEKSANDTLAHLKQNYPDVEGRLIPKFEKLEWKKLFGVTIEDERGIPLRKRGSGVRRLYLLSFFQAEAERKRKEKGVDERPVIYAIEEPETFQHPGNVKLILENLKLLASGQDQVIISSHLPNLISHIEIDSLRFIHRDTNLKPIVELPNDETLNKISESLGLYPEFNKEIQDAKIVICVEDWNDMDAFTSLLSKMARHRGIEINFENIAWIKGGGSELRAWVERANLDTLDLPKIIFMDSDKFSKTAPPKELNIRIIEAAQAKGWIGFLTNKREIENYLNPKTLTRLTDGDWHENRIQDPDYHDWQRENLQQCKQKILQTLPDEQKEKLLRLSNSKKMICQYFIDQMTNEEMLESSTFTNESGEEVCEITIWVNAVSESLRPTA